MRLERGVLVPLSKMIPLTPRVINIPLERDVFS